MRHILQLLVAFVRGLIAALVIHFTALLALVTLEWASHLVGHIFGILILRLVEG
jgi:hypothetical protein